MADAWDAHLYAAHTAHHRAHDDSFLDSLALAPDARVLDLGCGVGDFTVKLAALVPRGAVLGVDPSAAQLAVARATHAAPNLGFAEGRAQDLERALIGGVGPGSYDAVVSRATLHWIPEAEHPAALASIRRCLVPGGMLRAEFGGHGQIAAIRAVLDAEYQALGLGVPTTPWFFPTAARWGALLADAGFSFECPARDGLPARRGWVRLVHQRRAVPTFAALVGHLRSQIFLAYDQALTPAQREAFRAASEAAAEHALRRDDGSYDLDYVRCDALAFHPGAPA